MLNNKPDPSLTMANPSLTLKTVVLIAFTLIRLVSGAVVLNPILFGSVQATMIGWSMKVGLGPDKNEMVGASTPSWEKNRQIPFQIQPETFYWLHSFPSFYYRLSCISTKFLRMESLWRVYQARSRPELAIPFGIRYCRKYSLSLNIFRRRYFFGCSRSCNEADQDIELRVPGTVCLLHHLLHSRILIAVSAQWCPLQKPGCGLRNNLPQKPTSG